MCFSFALFCLFVCSIAASDSLNRCGNIRDDRSVYTRYESSNGHNIVTVKIITNNSSGFTWQDIINDQDKWDDYEPWVKCSVAVAEGAFHACEAERRGDWAMESPLPSLKVKFSNKTVQYHGMDRLLLNKHPWDPTRVKAKLSFELLQTIDNMASQFTQFVNLTVNDIFYGVYTLVEDLDKHMLSSHGLGKNSNLYKANYVRWDLSRDRGVKETTDLRYNKSTFETHWDIRGAKNHTILIKAYQEVFDANLDSRTVLENNFNIQNLATWLAFIYISSNKDLIDNNYAVYAPQESASCKWPTPLYFVQWDGDGAWSDRYFDDRVPGIDYPFSSDGMQYFWQLRVIKRFLQVDEFVDLLRSKMHYLITGPMTSNKITSITNRYKAILRPTLSVFPDNASIAWDATIPQWEEALSGLSLIPRSQYYRFALYSIHRPMPVETRMVMCNDNSSILFFWSKSFILYNQPLFYEFGLASDASFTPQTTILTEVTNNTFYSISSQSLSLLFPPNTPLFWRILVRNAVSPSMYIEAYPCLTEDSGWGMRSFLSPPLSPYTQIMPHYINNSILIGGREYATLDNVLPSSPFSPCSSSPLLLPSGWAFAKNNAQTRSDIAGLGLPWGGCELVLGDGARMTGTTARHIDGFGVFAHHLMEIEVEGGKAYYANCTSSSNQRILLTKVQ